MLKYGALEQKYRRAQLSDNFTISMCIERNLRWSRSGRGSRSWRAESCNFSLEEVLVYEKSAKVRRKPDLDERENFPTEYDQTHEIPPSKHTRTITPMTIHMVLAPFDPPFPSPPLYPPLSYTLQE